MQNILKSREKMNNGLITLKIENHHRENRGGKKTSKMNNL